MKQLATRDQKRHISIDVDESPAAQRSHAEDGVRIDKPNAKKPDEGSAAMSMRISLESRYEYTVMVRAEGIDIVLMINVEAGGFSFNDVDATGPAKTMVVIRRPGRKTGRRTVRTSNPEESLLDVQYPTGEPSEDWNF
eukprot:IDg7098t1